MKTQVYVVSESELEDNLRQAEKNARSWDRAIRKERDRQNMARFGSITFEDYLAHLGQPATLKLATFRV